MALCHYGECDKPYIMVKAENVFSTRCAPSIRLDEVNLASFWTPSDPSSFALVVHAPIVVFLTTI